MKFFGERGFSMTEGAIGMALLGGVAVLGMELSKMSNSTQGTRDSKINSQSLMTQIKGYLDNGKACQETLGTMDAEIGGDVFEIKNKIGNTVFTAGKVYDGVTLVSMKLIPPVTTTGTYLNKPARLGFVDLEAKLLGKKKPDGTDGVAMTKRARIWVMTDAIGSSIIEKCSSGSTGMDTLWLRSYWDASNIFYGAGQIGVGGAVAANTQDLSVIGGKLQASTVDDKKIQIESAGTNPTYKISVLDNRPVVFTNSETTELADLRMGELLPTGQIKVGPKPVACSSTIVGAIRYNPALNRNQVCARVEVSGSVTATTTCIRYESPEPKNRVTYTPNPASQRYIVSSPYQSGASSTGPWTWQSGTCSASISASETHTGMTLGTAYQCDADGTANSSGALWCRRCEYVPPGSLVRDYDQADPGDPLDPVDPLNPPEPGQPVIDPLIIDGITYTESSRTTYNPPVACLEYDETFTGPAASLIFRWVTMQ